MTGHLAALVDAVEAHIEAAEIAEPDLVAALISARRSLAAERGARR
jgi:hypothetical protein